VSDVEARRAIRTLDQIAGYHATRRPDAIAFEFEGERTSYGQLERRSNQVASGLTTSGIFPGDRIAYLGKNSARYFELLLGAAKAGAVTVPVGWRLAPPEMAYIIGDTGAKFLFVTDELADTIATLDLASPPRVIVIDSAEYEAWRDGQPAEAPAIAAKESDAAVQLYTSGTTGRPKGAVLSHAALLSVRRAAAEAAIAPFLWGQDDVGLLAMPVAHIGGTGWGLTSLFSGARSVIAREFDPRDVLDFVARDRVTKIFLVPTALQIIVRQPEAREVDFSSLRYILYGAAPMPASLLRECIEVFGCGFCQQYGMTETSGTIVYLPPEDHHPNGSDRMRSTGIPLPGVELSIVDEHGTEMPWGTVGEIVTRSDANLTSYWKLPEATREALDERGWLRTGDAGYLDEDGYLFIIDRVKDMIISGGENVYPAEVEAALCAHEARRSRLWWCSPRGAAAARTNSSPS
jgi:acyl-CoA synthetase (AMP-forming)/AMP-acid ligase II